MDTMTNAQIDQLLELVARLILSNVQDDKAARQAAQIVRDAKISAQTK